MGSRTSLVDLLRRAYFSVRGAEEAGMPVDEFVARENERRRLSRRRFLEASAAGAGLAILARTSTACDDAAPPPRIAGDADVAIVGGGLAGLVTAYRLRQRGVHADVYEANTVLGGRVATDRTTFPEGMHVELGGELIDSGHTTLIGLANDLGIQLLDYSADPQQLVTNAFVDNQKISQADLAAAFAPVTAQITAALSVLKNPSNPITYKDMNGAGALDAMSVAQWLDAMRVSGPIRKVIEAAYIGEFGLELDQSNALNLLTQIGANVDPTNFPIFGASDERFNAATGNITYVESMATILPDSIFTDSKLVAMRRTTDGARYVLTFTKQNGATFTATATHVVLALPFSVLRDVALDQSLKLPPVKLRAIRELGYGTNAKLICGFSSRVWRPALGGGEMFTDLPWQSGWETSRGQTGKSGIITNFVGGQKGIDMANGTPQERLAAFLSDFEKLVPGATAASNGTVIRAAWAGNPYTKGSYSAYTVGQYALFGGAEAERVENIHFAGEHTSASFQGFMEGAAASGDAAAIEILQDMGILPPPAGP